MSKREKTYEALREYLAQIKLHPFKPEEALSVPSDYRPFNLAPNWYDSETGLPHYLVALRTADSCLFKSMDDIFESKVKAQTIRQTIYGEINKVGKFPLPEDSIDTVCCNIFETLEQHYKTRAVAIIPLYNIKCAPSIEIPLANSVLFSGRSNSLLAQAAENSILFSGGSNSLLAQAAENSIAPNSISEDARKYPFLKSR